MTAPTPATTCPPKCPKCGAEPQDGFPLEGGTCAFTCGSLLHGKKGIAIIRPEEFEQSDKCWISELTHDLARALEANSTEYQRGRRDQDAATVIQSPTWEKDVVPLRKELAEARQTIADLRGFLEKICNTESIDAILADTIFDYLSRLSTERGENRE